MYNKPICGRSTGTYTNLGDLQRDLIGLSPTPPNKKNSSSRPSGAIKSATVALRNIIEFHKLVRERHPVCTTEPIKKQTFCCNACHCTRRCASSNVCCVLCAVCWWWHGASTGVQLYTKSSWNFDVGGGQKQNREFRFLSFFVGKGGSNFTLYFTISFTCLYWVLSRFCLSTPRLPNIIIQILWFAKNWLMKSKSVFIRNINLDDR
jgi:hypothetical protein